MSEHICTVCFRPMGEHPERDGATGEFVWPPPCCPGCDCGQGGPR